MKRAQQKHSVHAESVLAVAPEARLPLHARKPGGSLGRAGLAILGWAGLGLSALTPALAPTPVFAQSSAPETANGPESTTQVGAPEPMTQAPSAEAATLVPIDPDGARVIANVDGQIYEVKDGQARVQLRAGHDYQDGQMVFVYRYYDKVPNGLNREVLSGETWVGRSMLQQVNGTSALLVAPFLDLQPGDRVRVVNAAVASTVSNDAWVPRGKARRTVQEPFLVARTFNNRIQLTTDVAQMGKQTSDGGVKDYYYGSTLDFTYWPMLFDTPYETVEYIRFGAGAFQGETPLLNVDGTVNPELVRFIFGFGEADFNLTDLLGVVPSARIGLNNSGFGVGGGLKLRVGTAQNSHMLAGFEYSPAIGGLVSLELHHFVAAGTQFWVKSGIENLPAGQKWAGKVQLGLEHRLTKQLWLKGAIGMGGRRSTEEAARGINGLLGVSYNFNTGGR